MGSDGNDSGSILSSDDDIQFAPDGDSTDDELTTPELIARIMKAWQNEKLSPELLPPMTEEVSVLKDVIVTTEGNLHKLKPTDLRLSMHRMELKRLRYMLTSYLRIRLLKIQEYPWYYMMRLHSVRPRDLPFIMPDEVKFLSEYIANLDKFLKEVALDQMPVKSQKFHINELVIPPNSNKFVFFRSGMEEALEIKDANDEVEVAEVKEGFQYVMRYQHIRQHISSGEVTLI